jgi:hypothetical protein
MPFGTLWYFKMSESSSITVTSLALVHQDAIKDTYLPSALGSKATNPLFGCNEDSRRGGGTKFDHRNAIYLGGCFSPLWRPPGCRSFAAAAINASDMEA